MSKGKAERFCSFCGESQYDVKILVASPDGLEAACICDKCILGATHIVFDKCRFKYCYGDNVEEEHF